MINLAPEYIEFIKKIVNENLKHYKLYMFGSRVTGRAKKYSDVDIAILSDELTSDIKAKIEFEFENSTLPYEVDVIDLNSITERFKNLIKDTLIEI